MFVNKLFEYIIRCILYLVVVQMKYLVGVYFRN